MKTKETALLPLDVINIELLVRGILLYMVQTNRPKFCV